MRLLLDIGEIASDDCRGALGSFMQIGIVAGILYVYCIGPYVSFLTFQYLCLVVPIVFIVTFYFMPDSPGKILGSNILSLSFKT
jgi:Sugar (and other) transporter